MAFINLLDFGQIWQSNKYFVTNGDVHNVPMYQNENYAVFRENLYINTDFFRDGYVWSDWAITSIDRPECTDHWINALGIFPRRLPFILFDKT